MTPDPYREHQRQLDQADAWESYASSLLTASDGAGQRASNRRRAAIYQQAARDLRVRAERELIIAKRRAA